MLPGKLLALDVGLARIGVATCDPLQLASRPLLIIHRRSRNADFAQLAELARRETVVALLCGLPLAIDGGDDKLTATIRKWAERLAHALRTLLGQPLPIIFWDEGHTSYAAQQLMAERGERGHDDAIAAAVMLQSYLDAQRRGETLDYGRIELPEKTTTNPSLNLPFQAYLYPHLFG